LLSNLHDSCELKYNDLLVSSNEAISLKDKKIIDLEHDVKRLNEETIRMTSSSNDIISSKNVLILSLEKEKRSLCEQIKTSKITSFTRTNVFHGESSASHHSHVHTHSHARSHSHSHVISHTHSHKKIFICTYCMKQGHISTYCRIKRDLSSSSFAWVPKGTRNTNPNGPNVWVPKVSSSSYVVGSHSNKA